MVTVCSVTLSLFGYATSVGVWTNCLLHVFILEWMIEQTLQLITPTSILVNVQQLTCEQQYLYRGTDVELIVTEY